MISSLPVPAATIGHTWASAAGAQAIANRVAQVLQQFDVQVWYGDVTSNTNMGIQWFNYGQQSADQVFVMYTGGIRQNGNVNIIGEAFQPSVGYVNEYYAYTYATSIASYFMNYYSGATPQQYADFTRSERDKWGALVKAVGARAD